ncbi:hypothetical protein PR003_g16697 [Phytophthora rubi]|uniref:Uncharacterized protein n=1 Tax=Phytophthora rubi TaxID=129364 RepID=A0A6A3KTN1_9STRA|nr:hypothetical protein PR002_g16295 [Phytophthora rubi]KAE9011633.1 hypothetical protein PR001_g15871 [Phytophthora rubi]KAE9324597.1 hypothetical protein PR003_g16697 [Phytophthora rubi]
MLRIISLENALLHWYSQYCTLSYNLGGVARSGHLACFG